MYKKLNATSKFDNDTSLTAGLPTTNVRKSTVDKRQHELEVLMIHGKFQKTIL